ncbi:fibronectin type III domain-containing protein [Chloroflexota bacterium]
MNGRKWLILSLAIVTVLSLVTFTGVTQSLFVDDEQSTDDALGIRWGLFTLNDGFENTGSPAWDDYWDENGTTTWIQDTQYQNGGTYSAKISQVQTGGALTSDEIEASTAENISISFDLYIKNIELNDCLIQLYDGTTYDNWLDASENGTNNTWVTISQMITDPQYLIAGFRLRFDATVLGDAPEQVNIDNVIITTDTIPPANPTGLVATDGNEEITLDWTSNNETDLWGYNVYRSTTSGSGYAKINGSTPVYISEYTDSPLYGVDEYFYVVTAIDLGMNESGYSNENNATTTNVAPAAPTGLTANQSEFQISLDWNDNVETDLDGYNIYRGLSTGNYTETLETLWGSSNYTDTGLTNGITYYYAITATDNGSLMSSYSNEASDTPIDVPPAAPLGLIATGFDEYITLDWDDNSEGDLAGYNVYSSLFSDSGYSKINGSLVTTSNYTDTPLYGGGTFYYIVNAVDNADPVAYESANSTVESATATDIAPVAPTGLIATDGDEEITLDWDDNNIETDLASYNVYRSLTADNYTYYDNVLAPTSNYTDTPLYGGGSYYYVVTALDDGANESVDSNADNATATNVAPVVPIGLTAVSGDEYVSLNWTANVETDLAGYNIYRGLSSGNYTYLDNVTAPTSNYTDSGLVFDTYYYVITAVDNVSAESGYSDEVFSTPNDIAPVAPTGLIATPYDGEVVLDWDDSTEPDLAGYNIYRALSSGNYTTPIESLWASSNYTDDGLTNGTTYYYVVTAVDWADPVALESNNSTEASATPAIPPLTLLDDGFEGDPWDDNWDGNGITDWTHANYNAHPPSSWAALAGSGDTYLTSDDLDTSTGDNITVSFWFRIKNLGTGPLYLQAYNGTGYTNLYDLFTYPGLQVTTYYQYSINITDSQYLSSDFHIRFDATSLSSDFYVDDVFITMNSLPPDAPTGLTATQGDTEAILNWDDNSEPDFNGYNIYRGLSSGNYTKIESLWSTSNYTDTGRTNDVTYYYVVTAEDNGTNESGYSDEESVTPTDLPPAKPTGLIATPGENQVELDWNDNTDYDLDGYNIYRGLSSGNCTETIETLWATSSYIDTGRTNGVTYYYVVTAVDTANPIAYESDNSSEVNATPLDLAPAAPTGLVATPGDTLVTLDWADNSEGDLAGYNIYRSLTSDNYTTPFVSLWTSSNYTDTGRTNGVKYYYVVRAEDDGTNESSNSNEAYATPGNAPPAQPTGLTATAGNEYISINWTANSEPDLASYNIYRSLTAGNYTYLDNVVAPTVNYTDSPLYGGTYYYVVTAVDNVSGESIYSSYDSATAIDIAPVAPTGLIATAGNQQVTLDWDDNNTEGDFAGYNIYRSLTSGNYTTPIESLWGSSNYTDTGLTNGVTYYYVVKAVDDGANESSASNEDSARPARPPATLLDDDFEGTPWDGFWNDNYATDWAISYDGGGYGGTGYAAAHGTGDPYLVSDDLDTSGVDNITVSFQVYFKSLTKGPLYIQLYNGTDYVELLNLTTIGARADWVQYTVVITDSQYFRTDFRIRFDGSTLTTDARIDDVLVIINQ